MEMQFTMKKKQQTFFSPETSFKKNIKPNKTDDNI